MSALLLTALLLGSRLVQPGAPTACGENLLLLAGCQAHWNMDQAGGTADRTDDCGGNDLSVVVGDVDLDTVIFREGVGSANTPGIFDRRLQRDEANLDVGFCGATSTGGDCPTVTYGAFFRFGTSGFSRVYSKHGNDLRVSIEATDFAGCQLRAASGRVSVLSNAALNLNQWYHIVCRYDGSELRMFLDGVLQTASAALTGNLTTSTIAMRIDQDHTGFWIDDAMHFSGDLTAAQIADWAACGADGSGLEN